MLASYGELASSLEKANRRARQFPQILPEYRTITCSPIQVNVMKSGVSRAPLTAWCQVMHWKILVDSYLQPKDLQNFRLG